VQPESRIRQRHMEMHIPTYGFSFAHKIPLNPPFPGGDATPLFCKEGMGEILVYKIDCKSG
jgi:hypothetical protein